MKILPVRLTEAAMREISGIMEKKGIPEGYGLRLAASGGACAGTKYIIGFDQEKEGDSTFEMNSFRVFIEKKHFMLLAGMKVDFVDTAGERGFVFEPDNQS
jgi:iron-sulfur cluster assembly protein